MTTKEVTKKKPPVYSDIKNMWVGPQTITREEYYRRMDGATRPLNDPGVQRHRKSFKPNK